MVTERLSGVNIGSVFTRFSVPICETLRMERSRNWYLRAVIPREGMLHLGAAGQGTARQRKGGDCTVGAYQRDGLQSCKRKVEE